MVAGDDIELVVRGAEISDLQQTVDALHLVAQRDVNHVVRP